MFIDRDETSDVSIGVSYSGQSFLIKTHEVRKLIQLLNVVAVVAVVAVCVIRFLFSFEGDE